MLPNLQLRALRRDNRRSTKPRRRAMFHPAFEPLEDRSLLSTAVWTGGGVNNLWTNPANWAANVAPSPGDHLVFPAGAAKATAANDFATGTLFGSITFSGLGFSVSGNAVTL